MTDFWNRPMFKWRCIVTIMCLTLVLSEWGVLGFHEPTKPLGAIVALCIFILWCICDAVDAVLAGSQGTSHG